MMTLRQLAAKPQNIPLATSWYLSDLGVAQGKQELFTQQSPQKLKVLREHALIESAISSNRIEERVGQIASPKGAKTELIRNAIERTLAPFRIADLHRECPGVSVDLIRQVLKRMREELGSIQSIR